MIGLLFLINLIITQNAHARESNDRIYKILRDYPTLRKSNSVPSNNELNPEDTTKVDILSVLHDIDTLKEVVDNEKKVNIKDQEDRKNFEGNVGRTDKLAWLADLIESRKDIKVKELTKEGVNVTSSNDLKDVLLNLIRVLEELNKNIVEFKVGDKGNGFMMVKLPLKKHKSRPKRDTNTNNSSNLVINQVSEVNEETENEPIITNNTNGNFSSHSTESAGNKNGRRNVNTETPIEVKEKLLAYLNESFNEIKIKVKPLYDLKIAFGNNDEYKIGYVIANIDALEANLGKLEKDMEINKHYWDDRTILEVFDKLKVSNNVVTSLLESLRVFVKSKPNFL